MAVEKITLNLIPTGETPTIHAAQFDKERAFQIELKEGEDDFSPTGYDIELQVRKVDNNIVTAIPSQVSSNIVTAIPSQVSSNIVTFLTTEQMTACSGTNLAELQISKDNMSIATLHFYLVVQRDVLAGGLSSQSEIYDIEEQIAAIVPEVIGDEYYTADQVDEKIAEIPTFDPTNYYDKTQLYTKTETNGLLSQKANTSSLSTVAFTGSYDDLVDRPEIPDVSDYYTKEETYSQSEVNTLLSTKADTSSLSTVATSGSYDDLSDKPTIPGNASVLPISASDSTNTKDYIDSGLSGKANKPRLAWSGNIYQQNDTATISNFDNTKFYVVECIGFTGGNWHNFTLCYGGHDYWQVSFWGDNTQYCRYRIYINSVTGVATLSEVSGSGTNTAIVKIWEIA